MLLNVHGEVELEGNEAPIGGFKVGVVGVFVLLGDNRSQATVVAVVVAQPCAFPAAGQAIAVLRVRLAISPLAFKRATSTQNQTCK